MKTATDDRSQLQDEDTPIEHDLAVIVESDDIYALQKVQAFGLTGCSYCMISAAARRSLTGIALRDLEPAPYEVFEGKGGEWNVGPESWGWTHYTRMTIAGHEHVVLIKVSHDAAVATGELSDRFRRRFRRAIKLLDSFDERVMLTPHDCLTWSHEVWSENSVGDRIWEAGNLTNFTDLVSAFAARVAAVSDDEQALVTAGSDDV